MANPLEIVLSTLTEMRQDHREFREETNEKFDQVLNVQKIHNDFVVEQKTAQGIFKWVASIGGLSGVAALFKSFLN